MLDVRFGVDPSKTVDFYKHHTNTHTITHTETYSVLFSKDAGNFKETLSVAKLEP